MYLYSFMVFLTIFPKKNNYTLNANIQYKKRVIELPTVSLCFGIEKILLPDDIETLYMNQIALKR